MCPGKSPLQQIKLRAERIGTFSDHLELLCETSLDTIRTVIERNKPQIVVIDSIQTMYNENIYLGAETCHRCVSLQVFLYASRKRNGYLDLYCRACDRNACIGQKRRF